MNPFRVPVKVVAGTSGRVQTAFFAATPPSSIIIWSGK